MSRPSTLPVWATDANYPAGSDPWSGLPTKREPSAGETAVGATPGEGFPAQYLNHRLNLIGRWIEALDGFITAYFGDGSDGDCEFDGTNTFAFASKSGSVYTLTRDVYASSMTFTASAQLKTDGWRIYCRGAIDTSGTALSGDVIHANGTNAAGTNPGAGPSGVHTTGSWGGSGGNGAGGGAIADSYGGDGGDATGSGAATGGDASEPTGVGATWRLFDPKTFGSVFVPYDGLDPAYFTRINGGGGGGSSTGTAGGGPGGVLAIAAHTLNLKQAADLRAAGGNGSVSGGSQGGGGGGGVLLLACVACNVALSAAVNCPAGTGGTGATSGSVLVFDIGAAEGVSSSTPLVVQYGKEILTAQDTVTITFSGSFAYATATGASGYRFKSLVPYRTGGGDPISVTVTAKTTTGFTVTFNDTISGELDWETEGSV